MRSCFGKEFGLNINPPIPATPPLGVIFGLRVHFSLQLDKYLLAGGRRVHGSVGEGWSAQGCCR